MKQNPMIAAWFSAAVVLVLACAAGPRTAAAANAYPPARMTYQSYLTDANGAPLGSNAPVNYDVVFKIFNDSANGVALWGEQQTVTVDKGYFSVLLGEGVAVSGTPCPALCTVFGSNDLSDRFVEMTVKTLAGGADAVIKPRLRLLSAPYAFVAQTALNATYAANLVNASSSTVVNITGSNVGINKSNPAVALDISGSASVSGTVAATTFTGSVLTVSANASVGGSLTVNSLTATNATVTAGLFANNLTGNVASVSGTNTAGYFSGCGTIPLGGIIMWSGATVPAGWAICDGTGTNGLVKPDLRGRFVMGGLPSSSPTFTTNAINCTSGQFGGEAAHVLSTNEMPAHTHPFLASNAQVLLVTKLNVNSAGDLPDDNGSGGYGYVDNSVVHGVQSTGGGAAHNSIPPYWILAYIMRVQ